MRTQAVMMMRRLVMAEMHLLIVAFILLDVLLIDIVSVKLCGYGKRLLHGL